jgi:uncharacterized membrane protein
MTAFQPITEVGTTRRRLRPDQLFLLIAPLLYLAYALLTPPFQTFDENQHVYRAWQISSLELTAERRDTQAGGELPPGLAEATIKEIGSVVPQGERRIAVHSLSERFSINTPIGNDQPRIFYNFFGAVVYSPVGYMPQSLAVRVGEAVGLSVEWTVRLGRLFNCILCIALICWALRLIPFGRNVMLVIALLPPTAAGAASFGQDGLAIGAGFLLTALGLKVAAEERWSVRDRLTAGLAGIAVTLSKIVYLPLIAVAALPRPSGISFRRWLSVPLLISVTAALLLSAWVRLNSSSMVKFGPDLPSVSEQVSWVIAHPIQFGGLVAQTYLRLVPVLWAELYTFGDSTVPIVWTAAVAGTFAVILTMIQGETHADALTRARRAWMLLIVIAVAVLVATAMFVTYAHPDTVHIFGIQGRYLLPAFPLATIALMRRGEGAPAFMMPIAFILVLLANVAVLRTIVLTFYAF